MADKKEYLTKEKHAEFTKELTALKTVRRKEVAEHLEYAKSLGDLSENAEYQEAREEQAMIEDRIMKIENMLKSAEIVSGHRSDKVDVGATVTIEKEGGDKKLVYKIVGSEEADIKLGRLSVRSPLGEAMLEKRKGDKFSVSTPAGVVNYRISEIE